MEGLFYIKNWELPFDIYKIVFEEAALTEEFNYLYIKEKSIEIYIAGDKEPRGSLGLDGETWQKFEPMNQDDVVSINDKGIVFTLFSMKSSDTTLFITSKCNSNCIMCPSSALARRKEYKFNLEETLRLISYYPKGIEHITITGGEPFIVGEDIFGVFAMFKEKMNDTKFLLLSNGRALSNNRYIEKFMENCPSKITVAIPIHGATAATHDYITQAKGSFDQTCEGINKLLNRGIKVELRVVVSKVNYLEIENIAKFISSNFKNVTVVNFIGLEMLGNARLNQDGIWVNPITSMKYIINAVKVLIKNKVNVGLYNYPLCVIDEEFWSLSHNSISDYKVKFIEECQECDMKDLCGGIFASCRDYAKSFVKPIYME